MMNQKKYRMALDFLFGRSGIDQETAVVEGDSYDDIYWLDENILYTDEELVAAYQEAKKNQPVWDMFIEERNRRLTETDWWALADRAITEDQKSYRQALRDLPVTAEPEMIDGKLDVESVVWPVKP